MIYEGDALQVLKTIESESVDGCIMDPPYCSGGFSESGKNQASGQGLRSEVIRDIGWFTSDNMNTAGLVWLLRNVMIELYRIVKDGSSVLVFTDWRMLVHLAPALESAGFRHQNILVWNKLSMGLGVGFRHQHEMILHFVKGTGNFYSKNVGNVISTGRVNHTVRLHQTQKPTILLSKLLEVISKPGDTIIDPFFGSGSLGEACLLTNRSFLGIERDGQIKRTAAERIEKVKAAIQSQIVFSEFESEPISGADVIEIFNNFQNELTDESE